MKCLKINKKKFDQNDGWDCPICDWRKDIPRSSTRPSLNELKDWVKAADTLRFCPDELVIVNKNIALAEAWVNSIQPILQSRQNLSISLCRFYLRKIEGAEVFLPNEYNFFRRSAHEIAPVTSTPPPLVAESRVIKKPRPRKPKPDVVSSQDSNPIPPFTVRPPYNQEQRILPSQRIPPMDYQTQLYMQYPIPSMQTLPPKGVFAPPQTFSTPHRTEELRAPIGHMARACGSCNGYFVPGTHNEPLPCNQCQRLHHTVCIGKYGGRLYPTFVW
jgi:histone demethylase JARID1